MRKGEAAFAIHVVRVNPAFFAGPIPLKCAASIKEITTTCLSVF
jgi:hypothetical protein